MIGKLRALLATAQLSLASEQALKDQMGCVMSSAGIPFDRERPLDRRNRPDFIVSAHAIEVKIQGNAKQIFKQCVRYCEFPEIEGLVLVTNRSMGFPESINGKPCYLVNLGRAWL